MWLCEFSLLNRAIVFIAIISPAGKETAIAIAKHGGTVHMVCRNEERGLQSQKEIKETSESEDIHLHVLDMSEPKNVHSFASKFVAEEKPLHVLVNNAGCMVNERETTSDGLDKNFATNTLGTYMLTTALIDHMKKHESPRIITVTSGLHHFFIF